MTEEQRNARIHSILYSTDSREELAQRIVALEELVRDMWRNGMCECDERGNCAECEYGYLDRMCELGVDVN